MFCPECGTNLEENVKFCVKCGTSMKQKPSNEQTQTTSNISNDYYATTENTGPGVYNISNNYDNPYAQAGGAMLQPVQPKKKPAGLKIVSALVVVALVIGLGVGGFFLIPKLLMPRANNCVAVTMESFVNMSNVSSFDYKLTVSANGEKADAKGYLYLGKDLYSSVFNLEMNMPYDEFLKVMVYDGCFGGRMYDNDDWESYEYIGREEILDDIDSALSSMNMDDLKIDFNKFVKDGKINTEEIKRIYDEVSKNAKDYVEESDYSQFSDYVKNPDKLNAEAAKLFRDFLFVECEKEEFLNKFVSGLNVTSGNGGSKTYDYTIKLSQLMTTFAKYFIDSIDKYPEIKTTLKNLAEDQDMDLDEFFDEALDSLDDMAKSMSEDGSDKIKVSVTVTKNRQLQSLSVSFKSFGDTVSIKLTLENLNKVKPDLDAVKKFLKKAEDNK